MRPILLLQKHDQRNRSQIRRDKLLFYAFYYWNMVEKHQVREQKAVCLQELKTLQANRLFIQSKGRETSYLLANKSGFTKEILSLNDPHLILINGV